MRVEKQDGKVERDILIGMIVHPSVLAAVATKWDMKEGLFQSPWCNVVGNWCVNFQNKYGKPPGKAVEGLYENWSRNADEDTAKLVEKFLTVISGEYVRRRKEINPDYLIDRAGEHFTKVKLGRLRAAIDGGLSTGKLNDVLKDIRTFDSVDVGTGAAVDMLLDKNDIQNSLATLETEVLVKYPGALGRFYGEALSRDGLIAFLGPEKRGKTFALIDVAWNAMLQRRRVLFFEIGDMSKNQIMRRFGARATMMPLRPGLVRYPTKLEVNGDAPDVTFKERNFKRGYTYDDVVKAFDQIQLERIKSKKSYFKLSVHPNDSIGMAGIREIVQRSIKEGWVPDVIVIDYADLLAAPPGYKESRDQINANWKSMRGMSQEYHCLVVTATQANAASYKSDSLDMSNFSEDKRKFAHATGMIGLNQSDTEKKLNVIRYNWVVLRESGYNLGKYVYVAGCPELSAPCVLSAY